MVSMVCSYTSRRNGFFLGVRRNVLFQNYWVWPEMNFFGFFYFFFLRKQALLERPVKEAEIRTRGEGVAEEVKT